MRNVSSLLILLLLFLSAPTGGKEIDMPVIKIYYDNTSVSREIRPEWGFSALVKYRGRNILFDTGGNAQVLASNMKTMGSDPKYVDFVVISHEHWDHAGGLSAVLRPGQKVYLLKAFPESLKDRVRSAGAGLIEVTGPQEILPGIFTTGGMGKGVKEQALIIETPKGLVIVTGCSHPGIVNIVRKAKELRGEEIYFVIGGFHLLDLDEDQVKAIIRELRALKVKKIAPCHCTGEKAIALFEKEFNPDFVKSGAGSIIDTDKLD